jgi:nucleoside-diphosphate-sugar epimerase
MNGKTIFITGGAGYVGAMLVEQFSAREDVARVIALDKEPMPESFKNNPKIEWITANTSDATWQKGVAAENPEVIIHTAWQIREMYGEKPLEWKWNITGSDNVFDVAFTTPSVKKLIHFSTVASYGAFPENTIDHRYSEDEPFRKSEYLYAEEKRIAEEHLKERYEKHAATSAAPQVFIIRPAAITGPRGRFMRIRFGLQAALSGSLKKEKSFLYKLVSLWVSFVPITPKWLRQYTHEDDITDIVALLAFSDVAGKYEAFNAAPPGPAVLGPDMAEAVGKKMIHIQPWMARIAFFVMWHLTRGRIPTAKGSWRGYSYPIAVDGSKITRLFGYQYQFESKDAFQFTNGRYESFVPQTERKHRA